MMRGSRINGFVCFCFVLILTAGFTLGALEAFALTPYDTMTGELIKSDKWLSYENVRVIDMKTGDGRMHLGVRSAALSTQPVLSALTFVNPSEKTKFGATITPKDHFNPTTGDGPHTMAAVGGIFYNSSDSTDCTNDVLGQVGIGNPSYTESGQILYWNVVRFTNSDCTETQVLQGGAFDGAVTVGTPYPVTIEWDGTTMTFTYNSETHTFTPGGTRNPPNSSFKGLLTRVSNNAGKEAYIAAYFDNVYANGPGGYVLYDDFGSDPIDQSKWTTYEFVRKLKADDRHLILLARGTTDSATYTANLLPIKDPDSVWAIQATVRAPILDYTTNTLGHAIVGVGGRFFNDGTLGDGYIGDIGAFVRLQSMADGSKICRWKVTRFVGSTDYDQEEISKGELGAVSITGSYRLSVTWDGTKFVFAGGGKTGSFVVPSELLVSAVPAKGPMKALYSAITRPEVDGTAMGYFTNVSIGTGTVPRFLDVGVTGSGTVKGSPPGINCTASGAQCAQAFQTGKIVNLTARAGTGYVFETWGGACSGTRPTCAVTMDNSKSVTAVFSSNPTLSVAPVTRNFGSVKAGTVKSVTALFTVRNKTTKGFANLAIASVNLTGATPDYTLTANTCDGATLQANKTCTFKVVFQPPTASDAPKTAQITFTSNDPAASPTVTLTGKGIQ
ncbi:MAG TPA: hypothetical protein VGJ94_00780 [Syntrophorhabdaceae bacterium]